ncbi:MAG: hypothetical protein K6C41_06660 [Lachnospiraceae bacterium]|nr:hypothetical protein [Lachnospiraceae bacterium]
MKRLLMLILGIAIIAFGIVSFFIPEILYYVCGIVILVYGLAQILTWRKRRKTGTATKWTLVGAIVAFGAGLLIIFSDMSGVVAARIVFLILFIWLAVEGVFDIIGAVIYRQAMTTADLGVQAPGSTADMIFGGIMVAIGVFGIVSPAFSFIAIGLVVLINILAVGGRLIARAFTS